MRSEKAGVSVVCETRMSTSPFRGARGAGMVCRRRTSRGLPRAVCAQACMVDGIEDEEDGLVMMRRGSCAVWIIMIEAAPHAPFESPRDCA
jgi:Fe-S-cluster-containing hydrogenase component 2